MPVTIEKESKKTGQVFKKIYETVAERVQKFRQACPVSEGWALTTKITFPNEKTVLAIAQIIHPKESVVATGTAEEVRNVNYINTTSAVENAETSAIGRCLFAAGFGGGEFCSADELMNALQRQDQIKKEERKVIDGGNKSTSKPSQSKQSQPSGKPSAGSTTAANQEILGPRLQGIVYRREGNLIVAQGNTFPVRGVLDTAGFKWNPGIKAMAKEVAA